MTNGIVESFFPSDSLMALIAGEMLHIHYLFFNLRSESCRMVVNLSHHLMKVGT